MDRGLLFWGLALVTAGAVALAGTQGLIDRGLLEDAWRLWPVLLIAIGLSIILSRTPFAILGTIGAALVVGAAAGALFTVGPGVACSDSEPDTLTTEEGTFTADRADVELDLNCGTLTLGMGEGSAWRTEVGRTGDEQPKVEADTDSLRIESAGGTFLDGGRELWEVTLGSDVTYELTVSPNAASTTLNLVGASLASLAVDTNAGSTSVDLSGAAVGELDLSLNAGSTSVSLDGESMVAGSLSVNAGSIDLCTRDGTAIRIVVDGNLTFSHNLEDSDLVQSGETFTSAGFEETERQIDLRLDGNAASFTLNPEEGCE